MHLVKFRRAIARARGRTVGLDGGGSLQELSCEDVSAPCRQNAGQRWTTGLLRILSAPAAVDDGCEPSRANFMMTMLEITLMSSRPTKLPSAEPLADVSRWARRARGARSAAAA